MEYSAVEYQLAAIQALENNGDEQQMVAAVAHLAIRIAASYPCLSLNGGLPECVGPKWCATCEARLMIH